jgi:hypothetical protein
MPLDENAKAANLIGSIQQYFEDHLAATLNSSASAIDYGGGMPFNDGPLTEWVQVRVMGAARPQSGQGPYAARAGQDADSRGAEILWMLNVNCFVRPGKLVPFTNLRPYQLRDLVLDVIREGVRIPVKDYADLTSQGGETIGYLDVSDLLEDRVIEDPARTELLQHNVVFAMRWTETWHA